MMLAPGTILGDKYEIIEHLGSGGMADVYKAKSYEMDRFVAIKVLRTEYNDDEDVVKKFIAEAQATTDLEHPNIVNVYGVESSDFMYYIVMELAEGTTLKKYIKRYGRLSTHETVDFAIQIARGIQAAHEHHIVHRDIKPQNILVSASGRVKVTDFGIAKFASGNTVGMSPFGSVHYFSPEQARGGYADERSDIYSLGITLYEMATGHVPFDAENSVSIALKHLHEPIKPPRQYYSDIPVSLENIILKCTKKRPDHRYQSMEELIEDLSRVFDSPEGDFVKDASIVDDAPTNVRSDQEIEMVRQAHRRITIHSEQEEADAQEDEEPSEIYDDLPETEPEQEDEPKKPAGSQNMVVALALAAGILIVLIIAVMVVRSTNLLDGDAEEDTVAEATTEEVVEKVEMPNVVSLTKDDAEKTLKGYGLNPSYEYEEGVDENTENLIVKEQSVAEGQSILGNSEIILLLGTEGSTESETGEVEVPSVSGMTEAEAKTAIEAAGFAFTSKYMVSDGVKSGYVVTQSPQSGEMAEKGSEVVVTINASGELIEVPSLIGLDEETARSQLANAGLKLGSITKGHSNNVSAGEVMDQSQSVGSTVPENTEIDIQISVGVKETTYPATLTIEQSPVAEGDTAVVELVLEQDSGSLVIFHDDDAESSQFPLTLEFDALEAGEGTVTVYVDGEVSSTLSITAEAQQNEEEE